jgi:hypothetical protein
VGSVCQSGQWGAARGLLDAELCFCGGDLNYRLTGIEDSDARSMIGAGNFSELAEYDELSLMMRAGGLGGAGGRADGQRMVGGRTGGTDRQTERQTGRPRDRQGHRQDEMGVEAQTDG